MKLKTKIRAGKIRPNHNVTVHGTVASASGMPTVVTMGLSKATTGTPADQKFRTGEMSMTRKALSVAAFVILCMAAATSVAQVRPKPKSSFAADVPFAFVVGNRTLPAGRYEFQFVLGLPSAEDDINILAVRSLDGQRQYHSVVTGIVRGGSDLRTAKLTFNSQGDRRFLSQVWWEKTGLQLHVSPPGLAQNRETAEVVTLAASTSGR